MAHRIGILGGTFDPIHIGHLIIAESAADAYGLDTVFFTPAATPPHKTDTTISESSHRIAMVELAIADNPRFRLSLLDMDQGEASYTADLLQRFWIDFPDAELYFVIGTDSLREFPTWHEPERILAASRLLVAERPGVDITQAHLDAVNGLRERTAFFASHRIDVSATDIRGRCATGRSIRYLVPDAVVAYIREHALYNEQERDTTMR